MHCFIHSYQFTEKLFHFFTVSINSGNRQKISTTETKSITSRAIAWLNTKRKSTEAHCTRTKESTWVQKHVYSYILIKRENERIIKHVNLINWLINSCMLHKREIWMICTRTKHKNVIRWHFKWNVRNTASYK